MVQPVEQRQASWYIPFFLLPGSEAVLQENGWQLWQMWLGQSVSQAQMLDYIERLSDSGGWNKRGYSFLFMWHCTGFVHARHFDWGCCIRLMHWPDTFPPLFFLVNC